LQRPVLFARKVLLPVTEDLGHGGLNIRAELNGERLLGQQERGDVANLEVEDLNV